MALFGFKKKNEGGLMDTIRCDEKDFLIWKWRPEGQDVNSTNKENAIRTGSSIKTVVYISSSQSTKQSRL